MSTTKPVTIQYPPKSGIRIREIPNITSGEEFGTSFMVTIPTRITGAGRLRKQFRELADAKEWADNQLGTGRTLGSGFHRLKEHDQRLCLQALELLKPKGISILAAAKFAAERLAPENCTKTAKEVAAELIKNLEAAKASKRYVADLRSRLTRFGEKFTCPLVHITSKEIADWIASLELSAQTQKNFKTVIGLLFEFAKDQGYVPRTFTEHEYVKVAKVKGDGEIAIFTPQETARLLSAASPEFLPCIAIAAFGGLRSAEVERLEWRDVRLAERIIELRASKAKTASRRVVPIADNLVTWLAHYVKMEGLVWKGTHDEYYEAQQATAKATATKKLKAISWRQNALRHSYGSYRLAVIKNAAQLSLEMGNSAGMVFKHYREVVREEDAKAYFSIAPMLPENVAKMKA